jgi:hypothetical protein
VSYLQQYAQASGGGWTNNATFSGCTFSYSVGPNVSRLFGADVMPDCNNTGALPSFRPIVFWFFTYDTSTPPQVSATYCAPTISLFEVTAEVDINTGNLTSVQEIQPFNPSTSPFASLSQNVTGAPLNSQAFNGIVFNLTGADDALFRTSNATNLQIPAAIFQAASKAPGGLTAAFQTNSFVGMATKVYVGMRCRNFLTVNDERFQICPIGCIPSAVRFDGIFLASERPHPC